MSFLQKIQYFNPICDTVWRTIRERVSSAFSCSDRSPFREPQRLPVCPQVLFADRHETTCPDTGALREHQPVTAVSLDAPGYRSFQPARAENTLGLFSLGFEDEFKRSASETTGSDGKRRAREVNPCGWEVCNSMGNLQD